MSARKALWWLLPLSPLGIVTMLVTDGFWDRLGFALAAIPALAGLVMVVRERRASQRFPRAFASAAARSSPEPR